MNFPQWEEWNVALLLDKFERGVLTLGDLFAQVNEYRQFFPNLIFVADAWLTKFDVRWLMLISLLLACLTSFNIYKLGKLTFKDSRTQHLWVYFAANLLIFSPVQYDNWLQGQQLIYFIPVACLTTALLIAESTVSRFTKFGACAALSVVSTFSSANGLLCWVLVLPVLAWSSDPVKNRRWWIFIWLCGFVGSALLYLYDYHAPSHRNPPATFLWPLQATAYFFTVLGRPFLPRPAPLTATIGVVLLGLAIKKCVQFRHTFKDNPIEARRAICWWALAGYSILTAGLIAIGRSGFGIDQSLSARYTTFTIYLPIAIVHLSAVRAATNARHPLIPRWLHSAPALALILILVQLGGYAVGIRNMRLNAVRVLQAKACALFIDVIDDKCVTEEVFHSRDAVLLPANTTNDLGFLHPQLIKTRRLQEIEISPPADNNDAELSAISRSESNTFVATGRGSFRADGARVDAILLAYRQPDGDYLFAVAYPDPPPTIVSKLFRRQTNHESKWHREIDQRKLPAGRIEITAWAFDAESGKAYKLKGTQALEVGNIP